MALFVTVASGFTVSSCITLERGDRPCALFVPSMSGNTIRVEFATASGGAGASPFASYVPRADLDAFINSSATRPAVGVIEMPPTNWLRLKLGTATTDVATFTLYPVLTR
jgi:hypothetical protein